MLAFHITLAFVSATGFVMRAVWAFTDNPVRSERWVRVVPHVIDSLLLVLGVVLAFGLAAGPWQAWLGAKLVALLAYIGFGVLTLRGTGALKHVGVVGALCSVTYIFLVAFSRQAWPF